MSDRFNPAAPLAPAISRDSIDRTLQALGGSGFRHNDVRQKGLGYFGPLWRPDGQGYSTELSMAVDLKGKETEIPLLVPTLTVDEINWLLRANGEPVLATIANKAIEHARKRMSQGRSPFAD